MGGGFFSFFCVFLLFTSRWEMGSWRVRISQCSRSCRSGARSRRIWTSWCFGGCFPAPGRRGPVKPCVVVGGVGAGVVTGCIVAVVVVAFVAGVVGVSVAVVGVVVAFVAVVVVAVAAVVGFVGLTWVGWGVGVVGVGSVIGWGVGRCVEGIGWFGSVIGRLSSALRLLLVIIAIVFHRRCTKFWHPSDPAATLECP